MQFEVEKWSEKWRREMVPEKWCRIYFSPFLRAKNKSGTISRHHFSLARRQTHTQNAGMSITNRTGGQWWDTPGERTEVPLAQARDMATELLVAAGASRSDAQFITDVHLAKALQGDHERGVGMLCQQIRAAQAGAVDLAAPVRVLREYGATAVVDGGPRASGKLVCREAMALAIARARTHGLGWASARAAGEILTPFMEQAVQAGMVGMALMQSLPIVAPHGGIEPLLGNAPIGWGIPAGRHAPIIVDMSLTQTSAKGVQRAAAEGQPVPDSFLQDAAGQPTTDPCAFLDPDWLQKGKLVAQGSLLPIGAGHKGYALIFVVGLLTSLLTDGDFPWNLGPQAPRPQTTGTVFLALDLAAFGEPAAMRARADAFIDRLRASPRKEGVDGILYPGERSQALKQKGLARGRLELPQAQWQELTAMWEAKQAK